MSTQLHQFEFSHFNEKARWALDYKRLAHERISYLPGPHFGPIKKLSGQTSTPVLELEGKVIPGSAAIIDALEQFKPDPALYPSDPAAKQQALDVQTHFDTEVGPAVRTVVFSVLVNDGTYMVAMFAKSKSLPKRAAYRATFPLVRGLVAKGNGADNQANIERCFAKTHETLDQVAKQVDATGFMVGDVFSVADLATAALLAPIANVAHGDMARPKPVPKAFAEVVAQFADHPTVAWVNNIYETYR